MKSLFATFALLVAGICASAQVPMNVQVQILKAEDARRYDKTLEDLIKSPNLLIRHRAALAAGRIGDERAIPALVELLDKEAAVNTAAMAAFAIGEIESIDGADAILKALADTTAPNEVMARAVEAAGKIAAANPKDEKSKQLSAAILKTLEFENSKRSAPDLLVIRLGLTAALRARPESAAEIVRPFLAYTDPNIVADALNTLARLRAKNANRDARDLLSTNLNAIVRANAARVLGAAEDKDAVDVLIKAATSDTDQRVRVSAIRALGSLKETKSADQLLSRAEAILLDYNRSKGSKSERPSEKNELLELVAALGTILSNSNNERAVRFVKNFAWFPDSTNEGHVAWAKITPGEASGSSIGDTSIKVFIESGGPWFRGQYLVNIADGLAVIAGNKDDEIKKRGLESIRFLLNQIEKEKRLVRYRNETNKAMPDLLRAYAAYKPDDLESVLREQLASEDIFVRATVAELLAEDFPSPGIRLSIENAFKKALATDKQYDDAQLAMLDAMAKINKASALDTIYLALDAPDYLVRKKAFELLDDPALLVKFPGVVNVVRDAKARHKDNLLPYDPKTGTKLGQLLNTDSDYRRALSRKNGSAKAIVTTEKGIFTIDFLPEDAPLTVDNFVKLARSNYFNGLEVHRVVPNFVVQDGDPRGDGNGGPGWSIRCEINMVPYERGAVGMALSGKDSGGSQWFVTHSPQPHLDGGYTVFGKVNDAGMKVVDKIVRGDQILSIRVVETISPRKR
jgi:cyclophilin family peptidyl-prolyl cis-trans isomerase/HEAT repeat protein